MDDLSSVYKICPHCGQSVSVAAKFCPTCGTPFEENDTNFMAYERYSEPQNSDETKAIPSMPDTELPQDGAQDTAFRPPAGAYAIPVSDESAESETGSSESGEQPASQPGVQAGETIAEAAIRDSQQKQDTKKSTNTPPPMGGQQKPNGDRKKTGLVVTIVAAVLLVAVIIVGVVLAFRLGIFGGSDDEDALTLAQEAYDDQEYASAISQLEQMIRQGTNTAEVYALLAESYSANGDPDGAAGAYLRGYQETGDSTLKQSAIDAYMTLGNQARENGDYTSARNNYNIVLEQLDSSNSAAIAALAALEQQSESPSPSPTTSQSAAAASPDVSDSISPPAAGEYGTIDESEEVIATPTPEPSATPTPTLSTSATAGTAGTSSGSSSVSSGSTGTSSSSSGSTGTSSGGSSSSSSGSTGTSSSGNSSSSSGSGSSSSSSGSAASSSSGTSSGSSGTSATPSAAASPSPSPAPTTFELEDHTYEIVIDDCTWWTAYQDAEEKGGYLMTVTSEEEFEACIELAEANDLVFLWLGMNLGDSNSWDDRLWATGEEFDFSPWYEGEPSGGDDEKYLSMFCVDDEWYFNDVENTFENYTGKRGYIIEYNNEDLGENAD